MPAVYFCSGEIAKEEWHHYGLAAPVYTHFTSPIRRYADILVHRLLAASIGVIPLPASNSDRTKQRELCTHLNRRHKAAQYVQRASVALHTLIYFKNSPSMEPAYVLSVTADLITVLVPRFGLEGPIKLQPLADAVAAETVEFDEVNHSVYFSTTGVRKLSVKVFDRVQVSIKTVGGADRKLVVSFVINGKEV